MSELTYRIRERLLETRRHLVLHSICRLTDILLCYIKRFTRTYSVQGGITTVNLSLVIELLLSKLNAPHLRLDLLLLVVDPVDSHLISQLQTIVIYKK